MPRKPPPGKKRPPRLIFEYDPEERVYWDRDAISLGFPRAGAAYIRWLMTMRAKGKLMLLDPATMDFAEIIGKTLGNAAGEVIARMERDYLEGR